MAREFEVRREVELPGTPEQVWAAIATPEGSASWLFPMGEIEPHVGGTAGGGHTVLAWDPPHHFHVRTEGENGWYNALEHRIEARDGATCLLRYVHSGVFVDDWETQHDAVSEHTDFYLHTLGEYLGHFTGRAATYVTVDGPQTSAAPDAVERLRTALGIGSAAVGDRVSAEVPGVGTLDGVLDYATPSFIGVRTGDALYRFYGRYAFGGGVLSASHHLFADDVDAAREAAAWGEWLAGIYAT